MNDPNPPPQVSECWVNGYRSQAGMTWHGDPWPSLREVIARGRQVEASGRSTLVYRWHVKPRAPAALSIGGRS